MKKRFLALALVLLMAVPMLSACVTTSSASSAPADAAASTEAPADSAGAAESTAATGDREPINMWFWGANDTQRAAFQKSLVDVYNASQDKYELVMEYRNTVDTDIPVALSAGTGPDVIYTSGPSFCNVYVTEGKLLDLNPYSEQYGWQDRLLSVYYDACTIDGHLYSVPNSVSVGGIFYNKELFEEKGWEVPKTVDEMTAIMDEAMADGLYGSAAGNRGWRPSNDNFSSVMINHFVSPTNLYDCLSGTQPFTNADMEAGVQLMQDWYQKGYIAGGDYTALDSNEAVQLIADKRAAFLMAPTLYIQFAANSFTEDTFDNLGFAPMPNLYAPETAVYDLTMPCSFAINAATKVPDECAKILDIMLSADFASGMTENWPGYWATPLRDFSQVDTSSMTGLSATFLDIVNEANPDIDAGHFGFHPSAFFPPVTQDEWRNVDSVWEGGMTPAEYLEAVDTAFQVELEEGLVCPLAKPTV